MKMKERQEMLLEDQGWRRKAKQRKLFPQETMLTPELDVLYCNTSNWLTQDPHKTHWQASKIEYRWSMMIDQRGSLHRYALEPRGDVLLLDWETWQLLNPSWIDSSLWWHGQQCHGSTVCASMRIHVFLIYKLCLEVGVFRLGSTSIIEKKSCHITWLDRNEVKSWPLIGRSKSFIHIFWSACKDFLKETHIFIWCSLFRLEIQCCLFFPLYA